MKMNSLQKLPTIQYLALFRDPAQLFLGTPAGTVFMNVNLVDPSWNQQCDDTWHMLN